jgi:hypothetical protein
LAGEHNTMVAPRANHQRQRHALLNWFDPSHQQAGKREPAMIAALTQKSSTSTAQTRSMSMWPARQQAPYGPPARHGTLILFAAVGVHSGPRRRSARRDVCLWRDNQVPKATNNGPANHRLHGTADTKPSTLTTAEFITGRRAGSAKKASGEPNKTKQN